MAFREDFVWGAASSAYQTEGFPSAAGGGESIWDAFCRRPGAIANGDNGSIACDGYHRFEEDIRLLSSLGLRAYRFSTSWARIDPCIPPEWARLTLTRRFRGAQYCITVENPGGAEHGVQELYVNGVRQDGNLIAPAAPGSVVSVRVVLGG